MTKGLRPCHLLTPALRQQATAAYAYRSESLRSPPAPLPALLQVGRAGRFGTKGLAITFVSSQEDSAVLNAVQDRFDVDIKPLPEKIDASTYMNTN
jgi:hypothetical protein